MCACLFERPATGEAVYAYAPHVRMNTYTQGTHTHTVGHTLDTLRDKKTRALLVIVATRRRAAALVSVLMGADAADAVPTAAMTTCPPRLHGAGCGLNRHPT